MSDLLYLVTSPDGVTDAYNMSTELSGEGVGAMAMKYHKALMRGKLTESYLNGSEKPLIHLTDTGDGVEVQYQGGDKVKMDYSEATEMYFALKYYYEDSELNPECSRYTITKMIEVGE